MPQLTCTDLTLGYEGKPIIEHLTFTVNKGDYLCIIGENGSGKSTLIKTILKLKQPMAGNLTTGDGLRSSEIGYLPQQTQIQKDFPASVKEVVISGCLARSGLHPFYTKKEKKRAEESMEKLGISHLSHQCYRFLSGGQQQRVLLARALCATEKMLLLDEPVAGLDPLVTAEMYTVIEKLNREYGITIIMVSHDITQALGHASHILHLGKEPLFFGSKEAYLRSSIGQAYATILIADTKGGEDNV